MAYSLLKSWKYHHAFTGLRTGSGNPWYMSSQTLPTTIRIKSKLEKKYQQQPCPPRAQGIHKQTMNTPDRTVLVTAWAGNSSLVPRQPTINCQMNCCLLCVLQQISCGTRRSPVLQEAAHRTHPCSHRAGQKALCSLLDMYVIFQANRSYYCLPL